MIPLNGDYLRASIKDISPEQKRVKGFGRTATVLVTLLGMAGIIVGVLG